MSLHEYLCTFFFFFDSPIAQNTSLRTDIYSVFDPVPIASVLFLSDQLNTHHEL